MTLYLGTTKQKINMGGNALNLNLYSSTPITNGIRLMSSEGYILKDTDGLYLIAKEDK